MEEGDYIKMISEFFDKKKQEDITNVTTFIDKYTYLIYFFVIICIVFMVILHFIDITMFVSYNNFNFDYGSSLQGLCRKEKFEYETARFHIANNKDQIKIDGYDARKYTYIVLIVAIIVSLYVSFIFAIMYFKIFYDIILYRLPDWKWTNVSVNVLLTIVICIGIVVWPILYAGLKLGEVMDMSVFSKDLYKSYMFYIIIMTFIGILVSFLKYETRLITSRSFVGAVSLLLFFAFYICLHYIFGSITHIVENKDQKKDENKDENKNNVYTNYLANILGYKNIQNFAKGYEYIYIEKMSGIFATVAIILTVAVFVYFLLELCIMFFQDEYDYTKDKNLIKYGVIIPCLVLAIVLLAGSNAMEYNDMMYKYILYDPVEYYKTNIRKINDEFNTILDKEYINITDQKQKYLCRNYGNAILNVLYAHLFKNIDTDSAYQEDIKQYIDIVPEFVYEKCEPMFPYEFKGREYDIAYYLNGKQQKKDIFYYYNKCDNVNTPVIKKIVEENNYLYKLKLANETKYAIDEEFKKMEAQLKTENNYKKIIKEELETSLKGKLSKKINVALYNVLNNKVYYQNTIDLKISDEKSKTSKLKEFQVNNKLAYDNIISGSSGNIENDQLKTYKTLIDKIVDEYMDLQVNIYMKYLYNYKAYNDSKKTNKGENHLYNKVFVSDVKTLIKKHFDEINKLMSKPIEAEDAKLTKYIIQNYNSIADKIYTDSVFKYKNIEGNEISDIEKLCQVIDIASSNHIYKMNNMKPITEYLNNNAYAYANINSLIDDKGRYKLYYKDDSIITLFDYSSNIYKVFNKNDPHIENNKNNTYNIVYNVLNHTNDTFPELKKLEQDCNKYSYKKVPTKDKLEISKTTAQAISKRAEKANNLIYIMLLVYIVIILSSNIILLCKNKERN